MALLKLLLQHCSGLTFRHRYLGRRVQSNVQQAKVGCLDELMNHGNYS